MDSVKNLLDITWLFAMLCFVVENDGFTDKENDLPSLYNPKYLEHGGYIQNQNSYISDWGSQWSDNNRQLQHIKPKCVAIPPRMTLCSSLRYKEMRLPNLLGHDSLDEASGQANTWEPLIKLRCFPDTQLFLCSLYAPVCLDRPIWPCRSLCQVVKSNCEKTMKRWGFPWPEMVRCDRFPPDNDLCIKAQNHTDIDSKDCTACKLANTYAVILDQFCTNSDFVARVRLRKVITKRVKDRQIFIRLSLKKKKFYKYGPLQKSETRFYKWGPTQKRQTRKMSAYIENGDKCNCTTAKAGKTKYLIMGKNEGGKFVVTYLVPWAKKNQSFRQALRGMRNPITFCDKKTVSLRKSRKKKSRRKRKRGRKKKKSSRRRKKHRMSSSRGTDTPVTGAST